MPVLIEERWEAAGWKVEKETALRLNGNGGPPVEVERTVLVLVMAQPDGGARVIRVPFEDAARRKLVADMSGGIVLPPGHLPFGRGA